MAVEIGPALGLTADSKSLVVATYELKQLSAAAKDTEAAADSLTKSEKKAGEEAKKLGASTNEAARGTKKLGDDARGTTGSLNNFARMAAKTAVRLATMATAAISVGAYAKLSDTWSDLQSVVGAATKDMDNAGYTMKRLADLAAASYSSIEQTARGFAQNAVTLKDLGYNTDQMLDYTEALNHALVISAAKGENAVMVQNALSRAIANGKFQTQEFEVVMSRAPRVLEAIAKQMGVNVSQLRSLASAGKITGATIASSVTGELENLRKEAEAMPATIGDAFTLVGNSVLELVGVFDQAGGLSRGLAESIVDLSKWIRSLAETDFASWFDTVAAAAGSLSQALLILAATRIPALIVALQAVNVSAMLVVAGLVAMRVQALAMAAATTVMRGFAAAVALAGGPLGIITAGVTALGIAVYNARQRAAEAIETLNQLEAASITVGDAMKRMWQERTVAAAAAAEAEAKIAFNLAEQAVKDAQAKLDLEKLRYQWYGGLLYSIENVNRAQEELNNTTGRYVEIAGALDTAASMLKFWKEQIEGGVSATVALTEEQEKALTSAKEMGEQYVRNAELAAIELQYGKESQRYRETQLRQEREIQIARIKALEVSEDIKQSLIRKYDLMVQLEQRTQGWKVKINELSGPLKTAYDWLVKIRDSEPSGGWLSTAIQQAATLATNLWDAAQAKFAVTASAVDDAGNPLPPGMSRGAPPPGRPIDLDTSGGSSRSGGGSSDRLSGLQSLLTEFQTEREALTLWNSEKLELIRQYSDQELELLGGQKGAIERLELEHQERMRAIVAQERSVRLGEASDMFAGLASIAEVGGKKTLKAQAILSAAATMISAYETAMKAASEAVTIPGRIAAYAMFLGTGLKAAASIRSIGGVGGGASGGSATASAPASAAAPGPTQISIQGVNPNQMYTGQSLIDMVDAIQKELGNRGAVITFV